MRVMVSKGKRVRDPQTKMTLPADKAVEVPESPFWVRRLNDGDVVRQEEAKPQSKK